MGKPVITRDGTPVATTVRYGQGSTILVGFGSRWADTRMGIRGDVVPDTERRRVFRLKFTLRKDLLSVR